MSAAFRALGYAQKPRDIRLDDAPQGATISDIAVQKFGSGIVLRLLRKRFQVCLFAQRGGVLYPENITAFLGHDLNIEALLDFKR